MPGHILAVVGGQYGSEGKGVIVNSIANQYDVHIRVGAPNAGHSFHHKFPGPGVPQLFKMQTIPCGWTNKKATLIIGRGGLISPSILRRELSQLASYGVNLEGRLWIDAKTGILSDAHHNQEGGIDGELHQRIGSTGEGVGAARVARLQREPAHFQHFGEFVETEAGREFRHFLAHDTHRTILGLRDGGKNILIEGSQGSGLSLIHGPWPYVSTSDCNAAGLAADIGLPPRFVDRTLLVVRTMPIRVAGNSGPLSDEVSWDDVSRKIGKNVVEKTTVTHKIRRIGEWDEDLVDKAIVLNAPTSIAVTFIDYLSPEDEGKTDPKQFSDRTCQFINYIETRFDTPVSLVGTGGSWWNVARRKSDL